MGEFVMGEFIMGECVLSTGFEYWDSLPDTRQKLVNCRQYK